MNHRKPRPGPYTPPGVILLHASAVQVDGKAAVFLGFSGTGKSTMRRLLSSSARPLADDKVYLVPQVDGHWAVIDAQGYPLMNTSVEEDIVLESAPLLQAVFRLHQASGPRLEPMPALETCTELTTSFFDMRWHQGYNIKEKKSAFQNLAAVARSVRGYDLHFDLSPQTVEMVMRAVVSTDAQAKN